MNMQDNAQNNWRVLLENSELRTAEGLRNKNEVWEKLHTRLHKKRSYKFVLWHWVAAACLLSIVALSALLLIHKEDYILPPGITGTAPVKGSISEVAEKSVLNSNNGTNASTKKQEVRLTNGVQRGKINTEKKSEITTTQLIPDSLSNSAVVISAEILNVHVDSAIAVKITTAKKKLRVVHVNEIGQPAEESTANKPNIPHGFEFRIINNEIYNPSTTPVNNGIILFKSRNTSN